MTYEELNELLTENEKQVYLALLKLGEVTASPILEKTGLQNSVFYRTIHRLMEKGFVGYVLRGKIKHFKANNPEVFLTQIREKEAEIKKIIPSLKEIQKISGVKVDAEVFVGVKGILAMYRLLIADSKPKEEYCFFGIDVPSYKQAMEAVYIPFRKYRIEKKVKVYGIHRMELKGKMEKVKNTIERYTNFPLPPNMTIFRDKIIIASWGETPTGILIHGKDIAEQYRKMFWKIWKSAR